MPSTILIVEDEFIVASEIEEIVAEMGHEPIGIAADQKTALSLAPHAEIALVDLNLRDGPTGKDIGKILAQTHGVTVVFLTANPAQLGNGVPGTVGVLSKPVTEADLREVIDYAVARRQAAEVPPPRRLKLFNWANAPMVG
ncbi:MAG: response regulator [Devosia sp.]|nr:response regulator [Devosia sp.]